VGLTWSAMFEARLEMALDAALEFLLENDGRDQESWPTEIQAEDWGRRVLLTWHFWGDEYGPYHDGGIAGEHCPRYATFDLLELSPIACHVRAFWHRSTSDPFYPVFERDMRRLWELGGREWPGQEKASPGSTQATSRGPTDETKRRALTFRKIKQEHPEYSYARVAREATRHEKAKAGRDETSIEYHRHDVENAYRAMQKAYPEEDWDWERPNKIR